MPKRNTLLLYAVHDPDGQECKFFSVDEVNRIGGLDALEEALEWHCYWYAPLEQIETSRKGLVAVSELTNVLSKWQKAGAPKKIGRRHPGFGRAHEVFTLVESLHAAIEGFIKQADYTSAAGVGGSITTKQLHVSGDQIQTLARNLNASGTAETLVSATLQHVYIGGTQIHSSDVNALFRVSASQANGLELQVEPVTDIAATLKHEIDVTHRVSMASLALFQSSPLN